MSDEAQEVVDLASEPMTQGDESEYTVDEAHRDYEEDQSDSESKSSSEYSDPSEDSEDERKEDVKVLRKEELTEMVTKRIVKKARGAVKRKYPDIVDSDAELADEGAPVATAATKPPPEVIELSSASEASDAEDTGNAASSKAANDLEVAKDLAEDSGGLSLANIIPEVRGKRPQRSRRPPEFVEDPKTGIKKRSKHYSKPNGKAGTAGAAPSKAKAAIFQMSDTDSTDSE